MVSVWVHEGVPGVLVLVVGLGPGGTGTGVRVRTPGTLSKVAVRGGMCNSHRGGAERHEEGEKRVGVRRREGFGACEWNPARGVALRGAWGALWSTARAALQTRLFH